KITLTMCGTKRHIIPMQHPFKQLCITWRSLHIRILSIRKIACTKEAWQLIMLVVQIHRNLADVTMIGLRCIITPRPIDEKMLSYRPKITDCRKEQQGDKQA